MQCFYVVLLFEFLLRLRFVSLLYGFASNLKAKQTVCFYIDTFSFGAKPKSVVRACLDLVFFVEWILFGF